MTFWKGNDAAPSIYHTWIRHDSDFLRKMPAPLPKGSLPILGQVRDAERVAQFWREHYGGDDWYLDVTARWAERYLEDPDVLVAILCEPTDKEKIIAVIVSTPVGDVRMSGTENTPPMRVIEGLCVHPDFRGKGVAGLMISYVDALTSRRGPVAHLWARELPRPQIVTTAIQQLWYSYIYTRDVGNRGLVERCSFAEFCNVWPTLHSTAPYIRGIPQSRHGDLDIWRSGNDYVAVVNTRRRAKKTNEQIYEVVWSSSVPSEIYEDIASMYNGILFLTVDPSILSRKWQTYTSGVHAWYIYNYIPPAFSFCNLDIVREEI